jgi:hypothetical protein
VVSFIGPLGREIPVQVRHRAITPITEAGITERHVFVGLTADGEEKTRLVPGSLTFR